MTTAEIKQAVFITAFGLKKGISELLTAKSSNYFCVIYSFKLGSSMII